MIVFARKIYNVTSTMNKRLQPKTFKCFHIFLLEMLTDYVFRDNLSTIGSLIFATSRSCSATSSRNSFSVCIRHSTSGFRQSGAGECITICASYHFTARADGCNCLMASKSSDENGRLEILLSSRFNPKSIFSP